MIKHNIFVKETWDHTVSRFHSDLRTQVAMIKDAVSPIREEDLERNWPLCLGSKDELERIQFDLEKLSVNCQDMERNLNEMKNKLFQVQELAAKTKADVIIKQVETDEG